MKFDLKDSVAILERTPGVLRSVLAGLPQEWARSNEGPDTWSPFDVLGHLIDTDETIWMRRAHVILAEGADRRFQPLDRFRHVGANEGKTLGELLNRFDALRARNLAELSGLGLTGETAATVERSAAQGLPRGCRLGSRERHRAIESFGGGGPIVGRATSSPEGGRPRRFRECVCGGAKESR
jgi:hypothetical protein